LSGGAGWARGDQPAAKLKGLYKARSGTFPAARHGWNMKEHLSNGDSLQEVTVRKLGLWREIRRSKMAVAGLIITAVLVIVAALAPWIAPADPKETNLDLRSIKLPPSPEHLMGTDDVGRDIASRIIYGSRISLTVGVAAQAISLVIGLTIGAIAGYYGGWIDNVLMRFTDIIFAFPTALFAIAVSAVFKERTIVTLFLILGLIGWAGIARIVRGTVLSLKEQEYTEAARAIGGRDGRIILRHILPNSLAPVIIAASIGIAGNILTEAWLSFLGLGLEASVPSWGNMIRDGQQFLTTKPWICVFPGLAIIISVLGFNLLGDGLRDVLDPRLRGRQSLSGR
jgi:ABC-type dipeptide/oligopeptide/nickel transport system permease subunit